MYVVLASDRLYTTHKQTYIIHENWKAVHDPQRRGLVVKWELAASLIVERSKQDQFIHQISRARSNRKKNENLITARISPPNRHNSWSIVSIYHLCNICIAAAEPSIFGYRTQRRRFARDTQSGRLGKASVSCRGLGRRNYHKRHPRAPLCCYVSVD